MKLGLVSIGALLTMIVLGFAVVYLQAVNTWWAALTTILAIIGTVAAGFIVWLCFLVWLHT